MAFWNKILSARGGKKGPAKKEHTETPAVSSVASESRPAETGKPASRIITGVISFPHLTEKTARAGSENKYVFAVAPAANKITVKRAVENRFGVKVLTVNISKTPGKERRRGRQIGWKAGLKKAIVTLPKDQKIEVQ